MTLPKVLVTSYYDPSATAASLQRLKAVASVQRINLGRRLTSEELTNSARAAAAILISDERIDDDLLRALPELRLVCCDGVGVDHVDLAAATEHGVVITNCPVVHESNAEFVMGMMIAGMRRFRRCDLGVRQGRWAQRQDYVGRDLRGSTLGLLGFGRVARQVARLAAAFGMKVLSHWPSGNEVTAREHGVIFVSLDELLSESDILSIHVPLKSSTRGLLGARELTVMKNGAYLINSSRGAVVDESALVAALRSGKLAGAAIDVFCEEPPPLDHPLLSMDNVIVSPHAGSDTAQTFAHVFDCAVDAMIAYFAGQLPQNIANREVLQRPKRPMQGIHG